MKHIDWKQIDKKEELRQMVAEAVRGLFHRELTPSEAETLLALCRIARYRKGEEFSFDTDEERAYIMLEGACVYYLRDKASSEKEMVGFVRKGALIHAYPHVTHRARIWFEAESYILQIPVTAFEIVCDKTRIEKALAGAYW
ncbi:MAG: hypothetical protein LBN29_13155, partial [Mediterranea sp.]|nr:hypothetical protein [Mediterranea sp.]